MGEIGHNIPQSKIADALDVIVQMIDPDGASDVDGYLLPQKRIAAQLKRLAQKIEQEGGIYAKIPMHICTEDEYSRITGEPTVETPEKDVFYLVPNGTSGDDMYEEWVWNGEHWERFGTGGALATTLAGLTDVSLADVENGNALVYDGVLNRWINKELRSFCFEQQDKDIIFDGGSASDLIDS